MSSLEILSMMTGITGTLLLAIKSRFAGWAFVAYLASNMGWVAFGAAHEHWGLVIQHLVFAITSVIGIWVWLAKPALIQYQSRERQKFFGAR